MLDWLNNMDMTTLITHAGYYGVVAIIFLETGLFFCFFFPGDSLLFITGMLASKGFFKMDIIVPACVAAAILGYYLAYWIGLRFRAWLVNKEDSTFFKQRYLLQARDFYERHGGKALIIGRLLPIVRTFAPVVAGIAEMPVRSFSFYNILGGIFWISTVIILGYYVGSVIPNATEYILPSVIIVILLSLSPAIYHYIKSKLRSRK